MKIMETLIAHKEMTFQQISEQCKYAENIHPKTLGRSLNELVKEEVLLFSEKKYSLNTEKFLVNKFGANDTWKKLLSCAIESGEIDCYKRIRDFINPKFQDGLLQDESLIRFRETIIEDVRVLSNDESLIRQLKDSIQKECELQIVYKGKTMQVFPLCILISRDGLRSYLYGVRKKSILCLELSHIRILKSFEKKGLPDRDIYMERIQKAWDVDIHEPVHVKIMFERKSGENTDIERQLQLYFGKGIEKTEQRILFEGDVVGINDLKKWLRINMDSCYFIEPEYVRKELVDGLLTKIERYECNG